MTAPSPLMFRTAATAAVLAFAVALGALLLADRGRPDVGGGSGAAAVAGPRSSSTAEQITSLQGAVRASSGDPRAWTALGQAYLQRVRETGDPSFYARAEEAISRGLARAPRSADALSAAGTLALARHRFAEALVLGRRALRAAPHRVVALPVIADAQVELGRYADAARTLQRYVDERPTLASYARVSYFRELHGDLSGALEAMRLAVSAGSATAENAAFASALLGQLEFDAGHLGAARRAFDQALASFPGYAPARAGIARVRAASGRLGEAIAIERSVVARLPLPQYVVQLAEDELAAGRVRSARRNLALVRAEERLLAAGGVDTDVDLAVFEATHGSPRRAVTLARRAWRSAPGVRSADALGWALTRAGRPRAGLASARRALALGSIDPLMLYHGAVAARDAGNRPLAARWARAALAHNPRFSALFAPRTRRLLAQVTP